MASSGTAIVYTTDKAWFDNFRPQNTTTTVVDEVNFWRPTARYAFRGLKPGEPLFFRLKKPYECIAGFGFFATDAQMTVAMAWEVFGEKNGDPTFERFQGRLARFRDRIADPGDSVLSCLVLRDAVFLTEPDWLPWDDRQGWAKNTVTYKKYDLAAGPGVALEMLLRHAHPAAVADFAGQYELQTIDSRRLHDVLAAVREGQGTFRVRLLQAYGGQCAVTREHAAPVLDAVHIQPYLGPASNHPQNGLVLRTDIHRLYDAGYVTVTPELKLKVSRRLQDEFQNGRAYYSMDGAALAVPIHLGALPSRAALAWHQENVFR